MLDWIESPTTGAISSFAGVIIASIGFSITIYNVIRSKRAANQAAKAANEALQSVRYVDTVHNLSKAISIAEEMKTLNRDKEWKILLHRLSMFRNTLIEIKGAVTNLTDDHKSCIQDGIAHSRTLSHSIEVALSKNKEPRNIPRMNKILSRQTDELVNVLVELRVKAEG